MTTDRGEGMLRAAQHLCAQTQSAYWAVVAEHPARSPIPANLLERLTRQAQGNGLDSDTAKSLARLVYCMSSNRPKASDKFGDETGASLLFDSDGLQMASSAACAAHHAAIFRAHGVDLVHDLTAGIGGDTIAFARAGMRVVAYERDPVRACFLAANLERLGLESSAEVKKCDWTDAAIPHGSALFLDPPRRSAGSRWCGSEPAAKQMDRALQTRPCLLVAKLSPSSEDAMLMRYGHSAQFVSEGGVCKEAVSIGPGAEGRFAKSAVMATSGAQIAVDPAAPVPTVSAPLPGRFLYEADPVLLRSGALHTLAAQLGLGKIDPRCDFLAGEERIENPFLSAFRILCVLPYRARHIQEWLSESACTQLVVKTRGVGKDPEQVRREYRLAKSACAKEAILALVPRGPGLQALFLERLTNAAPRGKRAEIVPDVISRD